MLNDNSLSNSTTADEIMSSVRETIETYPFYIVDINKQVRIITGVEEGTFSWISTNYLSGKFGVCDASIKFGSCYAYYVDQCY